MSEQTQRHAGLHFPLESSKTRAPGSTVCDGIRQFRLPLPFALNHVNCWLLGGPGEHVLIDTGVAIDSTRDLWREHLSELPHKDGVPVPEQLLVTHFHPDHTGLAGWFSAAGSRLLGSTSEAAISRMLWHTPDQEYADFYADWYTENGLSEQAVQTVRKNANSYRRIVQEPPEEALWTGLSAGQHITLAGQEYQVMVGRGHAPGMLMLYRAIDHVLIAADQVLPSITPNVSFMPRLNDDNPLQSFLDTLQQLKSLPEDTLVLPSHGEPFVGLHARLESLAVHHDQRLQEVLQACDEPRSAHDLFELLFHRELDPQQTSFALGESLAHLCFLEKRGEIQREERDGVSRFSRV